jgi:Ca2+-binding RTX toxin-like protein
MATAGITINPLQSPQDIFVNGIDASEGVVANAQVTTEKNYLPQVIQNNYPLDANGKPTVALGDGSAPADREAPASEPVKGGDVQFSIVLNAPIITPDATVQITFTSSDETEGKVINPVLTFDATNWDKPQILTIRGVDDLLFDKNVAYNITGKLESDDINYIRGVVVPNLNLVNLDDKPEWGREDVDSYTAVGSLDGRGTDAPLNLNGDVAGPASRDLMYGGNGDDNIYGARGIDFIWGGLGNDSLYGQDDADKLYGQGGNDSLYGGYGNDELYGGFGNDVLNGEIGADKMYGGQGSDIYYVDDAGDVIVDDGTFGPDTVRVEVFLSYELGTGIENGKLIGAFNNNLTGNNLNNNLIGNDGNNTINAGGGNDTTDAGAGNDTIKDDVGNDIASGGAGSDAISTGAGSDTASGGTGNDTISTGTSNDKANGGDGADKIDLGGGADTGNGGAGNDVIVTGVDTSTDTVTTGTGVDKVVATGTGGTDIITDFNAGQGDKIDVSQNDANIGTTGVQDWTYVPGGLTAGVAGQVTFDAAAHALLFSNDTDAAAEFSISLTGVASFSASSLIF